MLLLLVKINIDRYVYCHVESFFCIFQALNQAVQFLLLVAKQDIPNNQTSYKPNMYERSRCIRQEEILHTL